MRYRVVEYDQYNMGLCHEEFDSRDEAMARHTELVESPSQEDTATIRTETVCWDRGDWLRVTHLPRKETA